MKKVLSCLVSVGVLASTATALAASSAFNPNKDPNGDGSLTIADSAFIIQYLAGKYEVSDLTQLDVDDNDVVSDVDEVYVRMYDAGMLSSTEQTSEVTNISSTSTSRNYQVYNAQTGTYLRNYSLEVEDLDNTYSMRSIIGDTDDRVKDWSNIGVAEIRMHDSKDNYRGTGFVVGRHVIATAAHNLYDNVTQEAVLLDSVRLFDENEDAYNLTPKEYHVPLNYITRTSGTIYDFDYALITVEEDLRGYMTFNLGVITDNANNLNINVVGFPGGITDNTSNNDYIKMKSTGIITNANDGEFLFTHNADATSGQSGSPIYAVETVNGITYNTVVGIHVAGFNTGVRFTPHNLKFFNGNTNIQY
ncbi:MAG: trypsin-like peptidase domain-containing protein [Ruminococcus sp.]|nr:trypsin-like peptidase domain-containing protein [Ruminococcus sp.]